MNRIRHDLGRLLWFRNRRVGQTGVLHLPSPSPFFWTEVMTNRQPFNLVFCHARRSADLKLGSPREIAPGNALSTVLGT